MSGSTAMMQVSRKSVASQTSSAPRPLGGILRRECACGGAAGRDGQCEDCQQHDPGVQRLAASPGRIASVAPPIVHEVLRSPGRPLDDDSRAYMEPRFGHDFSRVRIHTDARAEASARAVAAHAYTVGSNVVFGPNRYAPGTQEGRKLLAHELTHVIQQGPTAGPSGSLAVGPAADPYERQANSIAEEVASTTAPSIADRPGPGVSPARPSVIQRDIDSDDYKQGLQDGLDGTDPYPGPRIDEALDDYNEGYAAGSARSAKTLTSSEAKPADPSQAPLPATTGTPDPAPAATAGEDNRAHLDEQYRGWLAEQNWPLAAESLNDFADRDEIQKRLGELGSDDVANLHQGALDNPRVGPDALVTQLTNPGPPPPASTACAPPSYCPPSFCTPMAWATAQVSRFDTAAAMLGGIGAVVSPRVVPLWSKFIWGGASGVEDLSGEFGQDFAVEPVTSNVNDFVIQTLTDNLKANPPVFPPGENTVEEDILPRIGPAVSAMRDQKDPHALTFTGNSIPGNLAGGIGLDEASCPVGAQPSSQADDRRVQGTATITQFPHIGTLLVNLSMSYTVEDTIDLCPGNCGESFLTVKVTTLLSRWEASGISGDVAFRVTFPAPLPDQFSVQLTPPGP